ncbi:Neural cell adhesion molecule 1 [Labeo rohita]|uniref:Neural cell adhesion molecule 1 n=1 Tax=Labeo rohita TaxID=84645 RepID=A0ABQ8LC61_LABRO|nr:Neural cell adhesion molecule 1 [Labeo rohita]
MADKCHLCLLGLIILSSLLTGTSGVNVTHVFISSGENVRLPFSSSSSQTEISAGSSVTLYCQLFSYAGVSCDDWIRSEGIQLFWVNQAGDKLTISDSRYQISAPGHCIITLTTTLLNEDDNREWRCEVTHRNQVRTSVTYRSFSKN